MANDPSLLPDGAMETDFPRYFPERHADAVNQRYTYIYMSDMALIQQGLQQIQSGTTVNSTLNELVQLAVSAARSEAGSLALLDEERQVLKIAVTVGLPEEYVKGCGDIALGDQCCGRAALHRKPWIVTDMLNDPLFATAREASASTGIRAAFSVPVIQGQRQSAWLACLPLSQAVHTHGV
ncbi:MAG TPA: GAF domain-containing protein [Alphaproteobacteria bacterium]|nr:GAF domain-containing protein [Alphaproteobacteria bacterium]